jgi:ubiquinone/menaquinone biosynthesis C-methylase UbiE
MSRRGEERFSHFSAILSRQREINPKRWKNLKFLDFGGGNGEITTVFSRKLGFPKENVYLAESNEKLVGEEFERNFLHIDSTRNIIDLPDSSVGVVSALMVLHHVEFLPRLLREFFRVLAPGGVLFVRDHDVTNLETEKYIRDLHQQWKDENCFEKYYSKIKLTKIIGNLDFAFVGYNYYPRKTRNPQRIYHAMFEKKK